MHIGYKTIKTHSKSSTRRGQTPASITAWILSFVPSERYESAQHASVKTSSSFWWIRPARAGSAGFTCKDIKKQIPISVLTLPKYPLYYSGAVYYKKFRYCQLLLLEHLTSEIIWHPNRLQIQNLYIAQRKKKTCSKGGWGLPLQKFESVQVAFRSIESLAPSFNCASKGSKAPWLSTRSRHLGESPATFPKAHTAYNTRRNIYLLVHQ